MQKIIELSYHTQRNNKLFPGATCGTTCLGMILSYLNKKYNDKTIIFDDDEIFKALNDENFIDYILNIGVINENDLKYFLEKRGNTKYTHFNNSIIILAEFIKANWLFEYDLSFLTYDKIKQNIDNDYLMILPTKLTSGGHFVVCNGYIEEGKILICNDPWGNWNKQYKDTNGANVEYKFEDILKLNKASNCFYDGSKILVNTIYC